MCDSLSSVAHVASHVTACGARFRTLASKLQPLCQELESRASVSSAYATLLSDCHYCYAQQRKQLISPLVSQHIYSLTRSHDLPNMVRSGCSYLLRICSIEEQLFENFFAPSPAAVRYARSRE